MVALKTRSRPSDKQVIGALLDRHGRSYCAELGIRSEANTPSALFCWLCAWLLFSARINAELAQRAATPLLHQGLTTARRMTKAGWSVRAEVLNRAGYARYDERTSTMPGHTAERLLEGDLRRLRERAARDPAAERRLLKEFSAIGDVGADIFCREAQVVWDELNPFADRKALATVSELGLDRDAETLAALVPQRDFPRLLTALIRAAVGQDYDAILKQASAG